ncbi:hypothetical protein CXZ10_10100 [Pleomorphomonas diazotrophica]|uniref:Uncharacterized protein n=1 Tax=Pleomorphomonas diazotrophica TaxID=1166257 RepID=A0A1I4VUX8_9HYPH|nr:hypothetical protein [Pleomorphomonas diazotrophica]PKR89263.1 hypothetical protein CXZ10_10100 [Pleomorphomonas diazotrophica]SFN05044.1 hypothetical protein SAMN05192571_113110 [Pleomorphomonas diazotrophica]
MADYYPVLKRAISSLPSGSGEARRAVYEKARVALLRQLSSYNPPLSPTEIADQRVALEDCIRRVEAEVAGPPEDAAASADAHTPAPVASPPAAPAAAKVEPPPEAAHRSEPEPHLEATREEPAAAPRRSGLASLVQPEMNPFRHIEPLAQPEMNPFHHIEPLAGRSGGATRAAPADRAPANPPSERPRLPTGRLPDERGEPRIGVGVSALSRTLKQADTLGEASSTAVRAARHAMSEVDEVDEPASADRVEPDLGTPRPVSVRLDPPVTGTSEKLEPERLQPQREAATLPWPEERTGASRRLRVVLIGFAILLLLALVGAGAYAFRDPLAELFASAPQTETNAATTADDGLSPKILDRLPAEGEAPAAPVAPDAVSVQTEAVAAPPAVDPDLPPAPGTATAMAEATPAEPTLSPETGPTLAAPAAQVSPPAAAASASQGIAVAQRAILYEEPIPGSPGTKLDGSVVWSFVNEPALPGDKPVPQVRGDIEVPEIGLKMRLSIHKNDDQALPASHIVELSFDVPPAFAGKFIDAAPGMIAKQTEEARGDPITGAVAKVSDSLFWLALSGLEQDVSRNIQLLKDRPWIDIPIRYGNRRRAILTFEKGSPGEKAFADAFAAWGQ